MSDWQPIETAPKDGTEVLVWSRRCITDGYGSIAEAGLYRATWVTLGRWLGGSYWRNADRYRYQGECYVLKPTHWMPLPAPPEAKP